MSNSFKIIGLFFIVNIVLFLVVPALKSIGVFKARAQGLPPNTVVVPVSEAPGPTKDSLQLHTFPYVTVPAPVANSNSLIPITAPIIGGPVPPAGNYCIDDIDPDMCDDSSSHIVPMGVGGVSGTCGTVIEQAHKLVAALPQYMKGLRDQLTTTVSNCGYSTGPSSGYISTYFVIDAYNLAGLKELSKSDPSHVSPTGLLAWWKANPTGYVFVPYAPTVVQEWAQAKRDLTGCVMFFKSGHIGLVNKLELFTPGGDGVLSILQASYSMYIDRFPVVGWSVDNNSTNQTSTGGIEGFGCHS